jgi:hypothetical protein
MNCTKWRLLAGAAVVAVGAIVATPPVRAGETRTIQYNADVSPTIYCASGLECEIRLALGERIVRVENPQAQLWGPDAGVVNDRVDLLLKPETPGLRANYIVITTKREYRMWLVSYDSTKEPLRPLYTQFATDDEDRLKARKRARQVAAAPKLVPTPAPLTVAQQMDAACRAMPADEQYVAIREKHHHGDADLAMVPEALTSRGGRGVCRTDQHTFFQEPLQGAQPASVPSLVEIDSAGRTNLVVAPYDPVSRIFRTDDVAGEYAFVLDGVRLRIQRQIGGKAAR